MAPSIEQMLLLQAQRDAELANSPVGPALGAAAGLGSGVLIGKGVHSVGELINRGRDNLAKSQGLSRGDLPLRNQIGARLKPGWRMAGGLAGLVAGGGLGYGIQQEMFGDSTAGMLLSKLQAHGGLTETETQTLQQVLQNTYNSILA